MKEESKYYITQTFYLYYTMKAIKHLHGSFRVPIIGFYIICYTCETHDHSRQILKSQSNTQGKTKII